MFVVHLAKENFKFSCSHFTIFSAENAERLHGHNYILKADLALKDINSDIGMAFDFNAVKPLIRSFCENLDERILLPMQSPYLTIQKQDSQVSVRFATKTYSFPSEDVAGLPLSNITSEELARYACHTLAVGIQALPHWFRLTVHIEETRGQSVSYVLER